MKIINTDIPDIKIIEPKCYQDERGFFMETFQEKVFKTSGIPNEFVQDNHSGSVKGVLRGLHYQIKNSQGKLVRVIKGKVFDVAVDLRKSSKTFGKWVGVELTEENRLQLWIPEGFAHGFYVLSDWAEFIYKATDFYAPQWERSIRWDDKDLNIEWPISGDPILSSNDLAGKNFFEAEVYD